MTGNQLGEFLRARRASVRPDQIGLVSYGRRRVAGLRREEVADAAGMSADYYTHLERGRERHPSAQILDALSRTLLLSDALREHLFRLAGVVPAARAVETVDPVLRQMLENYSAAPAFVMNSSMDILAANVMARAFFSAYPRIDNVARMTFLEPVSRDFCVDRTWTCQAIVAGFRQAGALYPDDSRLRCVIGELLTASAEFTELWHSYAVCVASTDSRAFVHPEVGPLRLTYRSFEVREAPGQRLMLYQPEAGASVDALVRLRALMGDGRESRS
ncbi:transcriptional regulator [Nocardia sp. MDA0666]|uniref:helix-turn-helix transcriptional regulator n=1 Tax=Nocardia sp. MDA0666 TaxID=2135448 RepID=UPI000D1370A9|nr:helix-turn-helix transcriptional regulator [Nocardia sp. MDA0666]PSR65819.1 transcriptional regulator [Nocardia sp. MDA0666]